MGGRASVAAALTAAAAASTPAILQRKVSTSTAAAAAAFVTTSARRPLAPYPTSTRFYPLREIMMSTAADDGGVRDIKARKAALRKEVAARLRALDDAYIREQVRYWSV